MNAVSLNFVISSDFQIIFLSLFWSLSVLLSLLTVLSVIACTKVIDEVNELAYRFS